MADRVLRAQTGGPDRTAIAPDLQLSLHRAVWLAQNGVRIDLGIVRKWGHLCLFAGISVRL